MSGKEKEKKPVAVHIMVPPTDPDEIRRLKRRQEIVRKKLELYQRRRKWKST